MGKEERAERNRGEVKATTRIGEVAWLWYGPRTAGALRGRVMRGSVEFGSRGVRVVNLWWEAEVGGNARLVDAFGLGTRGGDLVDQPGEYAEAL